MVGYKVTLSTGEREQLEAIMKKGKHSSLQFRNACILLNCDESDGGQKVSNEQIAQILQITTKTVERLKQRFIEEGFEACMDRKPYPEVKEIKTAGDFEAHLVATSCSKGASAHQSFIISHHLSRFPQPIYPQLNYISRFQINRWFHTQANPCGGAGRNNIAWQQRHELAGVRYKVGYVKYEISGAAILHRLAVNF